MENNRRGAIKKKYLYKNELEYINNRRGAIRIKPNNNDLENNKRGPMKILTD